MRVARTMLHKWEEPCISGTDPERGSGAVFFTGCHLKCVFCQNKVISRGGEGEVYSPRRLAEEMQKLEQAGAYNINFVSPTHFTSQIIEAMDIYRPRVPAVFNTGGYELASTVEALEGYADIFLTDFKYGDDAYAAGLSACEDYVSYAAEALKAMVRVAGKPRLSEDGMMRGGVIVRHLVLPGGRHDSVIALRRVADAVGAENVILSLMSQYTPEFAPESMKSLRRKVTTFEYESVRSAALEMGFQGYCQDASSAKSCYTPDFSQNGRVKEK